jgi:CHAT domain-containing protein
MCILKLFCVFIIYLLTVCTVLSQTLKIPEPENIQLSDLPYWLKSNPDSAQKAGDYFYAAAIKTFIENKYEESLDKFKKTEKIADFINDEVLLAACFAKQGLIYGKLREFTIADDYLKKAKLIYQKQKSTEFDGFIFDILIELAFNQQRTNQFIESKKSLKEAHSYLLTLSEDDKSRLSNQIGLFFENTDSIQAFLWYAKSLEKIESNTDYTNLRISSIFHYRGEYDSAFDYLARAEEFVKKNNKQNISQIWQKYAEYYLQLGQFTESISYLNKNCDWHLKNSEFDRVLYCKCNLITRYLSLGKLTLAEESLANIEKSLDGRQLNESSQLYFLSHKGYLSAEKGNYKEAEQIFNEIYPKKDKLIWFAIRNLYWYRAFVFYKQNRFNEALTELDTILVKLRELKEVDQIKRFLVFRGKILFETGRKNEAYQTFQESVDLIETGRQQIYNVRTSLSYFNKYKEAYDYLLQLSLEKNDADKSVVLADLLKSRVLADKVLSANTDSGNQFQGYKSFYKTPEAEDLLQQIWVLSEKSFAENIDNDAEIAVLEKTFQTRLEAYNLLVNKKYEFAQAELTSQDITKLNNIDANIVSFTYLPNGKLLRFLFRKNKPVQIAELNINRDELKSKIKGFRDQLLSFKPFGATAQELYRTVLPTEKELDFSKPLVIIPDAELWSVPFSALITADRKYLVEKTDLALLPSLKSLILSDNSKSAVQPKVALFANSTAQGQPVLNSVKSETAEISKLYPKSVLFSESKATKSAFKQAVSESSILHVASHGSINLENPFESALILRKTDKDDGKLTVNEIIDYKIPSSLVVLSACDTSNGQIFGGEGLLSLAWAFLVGGAKEVVGAQWKINDIQSKKMMVDFHKELKKSGNPIYALQQSQKKALQNTAPFNHPYYWSGFVAIGGFR